MRRLKSIWHALKYASFRGLSLRFTTMSSLTANTKKRNYSEEEVDVLTSEVAKHRKVLFGSSISGVSAPQKAKVWVRVAQQVNSVSRDVRTPSEVCYTI